MSSTDTLGSITHKVNESIKMVTPAERESDRHFRKKKEFLRKRRKDSVVLHSPEEDETPLHVIDKSLEKDKNEEQVLPKGQKSDLVVQ